MEINLLFDATGDGEVAQDAQLQIHPVPAAFHHEDYARRSKNKLKKYSMRDIFFCECSTGVRHGVIVVMVATINKCIL